MYSLSNRVVAGAVGDHGDQWGGDVTVVRHGLRAGVAVELPPGPVAHLRRPGLSAEHDALLEQRRQRHRVIERARFDLCKQAFPPMNHGGYSRTLAPAVPSTLVVFGAIKTMSFAEVLVRDRSACPACGTTYVGPSAGFGANQRPRERSPSS